MSIPIGWEANAFNQVPESSNRIHSDEMARSLGFTGALVPGVTVSAYLVHPGLIAWGADFLNRSKAEVTVHKPLYDGHNFEVTVSEASAGGYSAKLMDSSGVVCATARVELLNMLPEPPVYRGDALLTKDTQRPEATPENMALLKLQGLSALVSTWETEQPMSSYLKDSNLMPELLRVDAGGMANAGYLLGLTNGILSGNALMNPWIHLQTSSCFFKAVALNTELIVECAIKDLFNRKGHEFVDIDVFAFERATKKAVMSAELRAIYQVRGATP